MHRLSVVDEQYTPCVSVIFNTAYTMHYVIRYIRGIYSRVYKYTGSATPTMCPINNARRSCVVVTLLFCFLALFFEFVCQIYQRLRLLPGVSKFVRAGITAVYQFHLSEKISDSCEYLYLPDIIFHGR